ncbi:hypothetical protein GXN76_00545 [Kroppenstedtia pulmonis]|uniref:Septum formation initiator family protein n=1 Tax=Kroppenstedtia pulmonis TaxID=1380685 RepID=A0A7D4BUG0_9BACL|nr:hypothetical protein [Kroppenstedtia pulmonis]QKG83093.1 hypothetical protein GXN76_00545 [Kroppenstedtia pulmonis]
MADRGKTAKVVEIHSSIPPSGRGQGPPEKKPLPSNLRRRRRIWLICMVAFSIWGITEWWSQEQALEARQVALEEQKKHVATLTLKHKHLKEKRNRLYNEEYLTELARKMGYRFAGEEVYDTTSPR